MVSFTNKYGKWVFLILSIIPGVVESSACTAGSNNCLICDPTSTYCIQCLSTYPYISSTAQQTCTDCGGALLKYHNPIYPLPLCAASCPAGTTPLVGEGSGWCSIKDCGSDPIDMDNYLESLLCKAGRCKKPKKALAYPSLLKGIMDVDGLLGAQGCGDLTLTLLYKGTEYQLDSECPHGYRLGTGGMEKDICCEDNCEKCRHMGECHNCNEGYTEGVWSISMKTEFCTNCNSPGEEISGNKCLRTPTCEGEVIEESFCGEGTCPIGMYQNNPGDCIACEDINCAVCIGPGISRCSLCKSGYQVEGAGGVSYCACDGLIKTDTLACHNSDTCPSTYYKSSELECILCADSNCATCLGGDQTQCTLCSNTFMLATTAAQFTLSGGHACINSCPPEGRVLIHPLGFEVCITDGAANRPEGFFLATDNKYKECEENCAECTELGLKKCINCLPGYYLKVEKGSEFSERGECSCTSIEGKSLINENTKDVSIIDGVCPTEYYESGGECIKVEEGEEKEKLEAIAKIIPCIDQDDFTIPITESMNITAGCFLGEYENKNIGLNKMVICSLSPTELIHCILANTTKLQPVFGTTSMYLPPGSLPVGVYYFQVKISHGHKYKLAITRVTVVENGIYVSLGCRDIEKGGVFVRNQKYRFTSYTLATSTNIKWSITPPNIGFKSHRGMAVIQKNSLEAGNIYTVSVTVNSTTESLTFNVSEYIHRGQVKVTPDMGTGFRDTYIIKAEDWSDVENPDAHLLYKFSFHWIDGPELVFSNWGRSPQVYYKLPVGSAMNEYKLYITGYAKSSQGVITSNQVVITSTPFTPLEHSEQLQFIADYFNSSTKATKTTSQRLVDVFMAQSMIDYQTDWNNYTWGICPDCGVHGSCDQATKKCLCHDGWDFAPKCDLSTLQVQNTRQKVDLIINELEELTHNNIYASIPQTESLVSNLKQISRSSPLLESEALKKIEKMTSNTINKLNITYKKEQEIFVTTRSDILGILSDLMEGYEQGKKETLSIRSLLEALSTQNQGYLDKIFHPSTECTFSFCWSSSQGSPWDLSQNSLTSLHHGVGLTLPLFTTGGNLSTPIDIIAYEQVDWKISPFIGNANHAYEIGNVLEIILWGGDGRELNFGEDNINDNMQIASANPVKLIFEVPAQLYNSSDINCSYYDPNIGYSTQGMTLHQSTLNTETGYLRVECLSTHLSAFVLVASEIFGVVLNANYDRLDDAEALEDYEPFKSIPFLLSFSFLIIFLLGLVTMWCYLRYKNKDKVKVSNLQDIPDISRIELDKSNSFDVIPSPRSPANKNNSDDDKANSPSGGERSNLDFENIGDSNLYASDRNFIPSPKYDPETDKEAKLIRSGTNKKIDKTPKRQLGKTNSLEIITEQRSFSLHHKSGLSPKVYYSPTSTKNAKEIYNKISLMKTRGSSTSVGSSIIIHPCSEESEMPGVVPSSPCNSDINNQKSSPLSARLDKDKSTNMWFKVQNPTRMAHSSQRKTRNTMPTNAQIIDFGEILDESKNENTLTEEEGKKKKRSQSTKTVTKSPRERESEMSLKLPQTVIAFPTFNIPKVNTEKVKIPTKRESKVQVFTETSCRKLSNRSPRQANSSTTLMSPVAQNSFNDNVMCADQLMKEGIDNSMNMINHSKDLEEIGNLEEIEQNLEEQDKKKGSDCGKFCGVFQSFHSILNPFVDDEENRISRLSKFCLLYSEVLLLFLFSGLFFNTETGEDIGSEMSMLGSALIGILIGLLTLPILIIPGFLLRRQKSPSLDNLYSVEERKDKLKSFERKQCCRLAFGIILVILVMLVANFYINVFAASFGTELGNRWAMTFIFALLEDILLLQTVKCLVLFCCTSDDALSVVLELCIGNAL